MNQLIIKFLSLALFITTTHKYYVSTTLIDFDLKTKSFEITLKVFYDDLELALNLDSKNIIDGVDYYIFEKLKFRPKIICMEYNFWFGSELKCSIPYSENFKWEIGSPYSGASLNAICSLAFLKDYHLIALESSSVNAFFVRGDLKHHFKVLDPIKNFKNPIRHSISKVKKIQII